MATTGNKWISLVSESPKEQSDTMSMARSQHAMVVRISLSAGPLVFCLVTVPPRLCPFAP